MSDPNDLESEQAEDDTALEDKQRFLDKFRGTGVGVEDPNIVGEGDVTDVPPGPDPDPPAPTPA